MPLPAKSPTPAVRPQPASVPTTLEPLFVKRRFADVLDTVGPLLAKDPENPGLLKQRGRAYLGLARVKEAQADLAQAVGLAPEDGEAIGYLACTHAEMGDLAEADKLHEQSIARAPGLARVYLLRSQTRILQGHRNDALADCEKALELAPNLADAWVARARSLLRVRQVRPGPTRLR